VIIDTKKLKQLKDAESLALLNLGKTNQCYSVEKEFQAVKFLASHSPLSICIDVGGYHGEYTDEIIKYYPFSEIIVFEPQKKLAENLIKKFETNRLVTVETTSLDKEMREATLYKDTTDLSLSSFTKRDIIDYELSEEEKVPAIPFEYYWREGLDSMPIDFCKIDVEGHELDVLKGFGQAIHSTHLIQFEFGDCNVDTRTFFKDFWKFFQEHNFDLFRVSSEGIIPITYYSSIDETFSTTNYIARRKRV